MSRNPWLLGALAASIALALTACIEPPPPSLSYEDRTLVDSLYQEAVLTLRPEIDSTCTARTDSMVAFYRDSLLPVRRQEIARQLQRIRQYEAQ